MVLYIDDLDRCRTAQVVEVLQAVHLRLALNLFAVMVGVDPNWLIRSLRDQYPGVLADGRQAGQAEEDANVAAHPADYLEKIFNIPFTLPSSQCGGDGGHGRGACSPGATDDGPDRERRRPGLGRRSAAFRNDRRTEC